jgi:magnesium chelatase family protein
VEAQPVQVEVNAGEFGEAGVYLVGLPDAAVKESKDRVSSALANSGFRMPQTRTTINLAPGHLRKEGPCYDLPIALGLLAATNQLRPETLEGYLIAGEMSLSGALRPVRGGLAFGLLARKQKLKGVLLPAESAEEAVLAEGVSVYPVKSLDEAVRFLEGDHAIAPMEPGKSSFYRRPDVAHTVDFSEIKGQHQVRRAVEIAVAGGHNLLILFIIALFP